MIDRVNFSSALRRGSRDCKWQLSTIIDLSELGEVRAKPDWFLVIIVIEWPFKPGIYPSWKRWKPRGHHFYWFLYSQLLSCFIIYAILYKIVWVIRYENKSEKWRLQINNFNAQAFSRAEKSSKEIFNLKSGQTTL